MDLLASTRLLTLTGPGGVGKTRLSLAIGEVVAAGYADGAWLVELSAVSNPALVPSVVATVVGVRESARPMIEQLEQVLRSRAMLLVLDNCEHLVESCAALADSLLRGCPRLQIVCTSREPLNVSGEVVWRVPGLSVVGGNGDDDDAHQTPEAVRLFVERARAVSSAFRLTEHNVASIAEICRRLDGLPLAIELAAAWVGVLTPQQIVARLGDRFDLLRSGRRTAPARQQTLEATIEWSYDLLTDAERSVLERLSVFSGGCTFEAAEDVCGDPRLPAGRTLDLLARLVDKSLLVAEERFGEARYRLLESILVYGRHRLSDKPEQTFETHRRHAAYFVALAEKAQSQLRGANQLWWMNRLELEHDNIRAALRRSLEAGDSETALRLGGALWYFWQIRGHVREGYDWLGRAIQQPNLRPSLALAKTLRAAGSMSSFCGKQHEARARFREALDMFESFGDARGIASTLNNLGVVATDLGEYLEAETNLERGLVMHGDTQIPNVAISLGNLGCLAEAQGDGVKALGYHRRALAIWRSIDDQEGVATSLCWQAELLRRMGKQASSRSLVEEALKLAAEVDSKPRICRGLRTLGSLAADSRELARATALLSESLRVAAEAGFDREASTCLIRLAGVALQSRQQVKVVHMLAAYDGLRRSGGWVPYLQERDDYERCLTQARASMTNEEFLAAWSVGQRMPLQLFVAEPALTRSSLLEPASGYSDHGGLTPREMEVVRLVARGHNNREIAGELVIAVSTAERHIANILRKLDLTSRTQIAAWFIKRSRAGT